MPICVFCPGLGGPDLYHEPRDAGRFTVGHAELATPPAKASMSPLPLGRGLSVDTVDSSVAPSPIPPDAQSQWGSPWNTEPLQTVTGTPREAATASPIAETQQSPQAAATPPQGTATPVQPSQPEPTPEAATPMQPSQNTPPAPVQPSQPEPTPEAATPTQPSQNTPPEAKAALVQQAQTTPLQVDATQVQPSQTAPTAEAATPMQPSQTIPPTQVQPSQSESTPEAATPMQPSQNTPPEAKATLAQPTQTTPPGVDATQVQPTAPPLAVAPTPGVATMLPPQPKATAAQSSQIATDSTPTQPSKNAAPEATATLAQPKQTAPPLAATEASLSARTPRAPTMGQQQPPSQTAPGSSRDLAVPDGQVQPLANIYEGGCYWQPLACITYSKHLKNTLPKIGVPKTIQKTGIPYQDSPTYYI